MGDGSRVRFLGPEPALDVFGRTKERSHFGDRPHVLPIASRTQNPLRHGYLLISSEK
ncbi:hypothetical protein DPMN_004286, partial [Dreissena polymorpha]